MRNRITCSVAVVLFIASAASAQGPQVVPLRLNNLVTRLAEFTQIPAEKDSSLPFHNPRLGWVLVAVDGGSAITDGAAMDVRLQSTTETIPLRLGAESREAIRLLPAGDYALLIHPSGAALASVTVRAIPELQYCRYPSQPAAAAYGPYDWEFLTAHVLPHVNTIVGAPSEESDAHITEWTRNCGKWIAYGGLPHDQHLTAEQALIHWTQNAGFTDPRLSGLIADEFQGRHNEWYPAWTEALARMGADPALKGRWFYGYCGGPGMYTRPQPRALVRTVLDAGYYMAWERYLHEMPTLEEAQALLESHLGREMTKWQAAFPDCQKQMILVSGLFTHGLSLDVQPEVDYKVWMDMQMRYLATQPGFDGLFGLQWWVSQYADEETLRWMAQLFRHYAIEGKTDSFAEPLGYAYLPGLIANPEFADGLNVWDVAPAGADTLRPEYMEYYGRLQGRYWHRAGEPDEPAGNTFLWMKRNAEKPNTISQPVRNLKPGSLYSVKVMAADYLDISLGVSKEKDIPLAVSVEGADVIPEKTFVAHMNSSSSSPSKLPFNGQRPAWFVLHRMVFRAQSSTAVLRISDWPSINDPGGPEGQELMVNGIAVQPYYGE
ncbi:MAG: hypothetical protein IT365_26965 [Candidatus Hydrogenedentes bacterium]|nr:hypothetical protein [Candidatus Hydrogenedentota bacterium]